MKKKVHIAREKKKSQETNRVEITGIVMILLGFFVCLSLSGYGMGIVEWPHLGRPLFLSLRE